MAMIRVSPGGEHTRCISHHRGQIGRVEHVQRAAVAQGQRVMGQREHARGTSHVRATVSPLGRRVQPGAQRETHRGPSPRRRLSSTHQALVVKAMSTGPQRHPRPRLVRTAEAPQGWGYPPTHQRAASHSRAQHHTHARSITLTRAHATPSSPLTASTRDRGAG